MNAILDMKAPLSAGPFLKISNNLGDVADAATSRTNLGLIAGGAGDIWVKKAGDVMTGDLEIQDSGGPQLRLTHTGGSKFADLTLDTNHGLTIQPSDTGSITFQSTVDSDAFFRVLNSVGDRVFSVDVVNNRVAIATINPDAALEVLDATGAQLRLTFEDSVKFADLTVDTNHTLTITPSSTGKVIFQSTIDSVDFFQILDAGGGTPILQVDSTNENIAIGHTTTTLGKASIITDDNAKISLVIKQKSGQTALMTDWQDSAGVTITSVSTIGELFTATSSATTGATLGGTSIKLQNKNATVGNYSGFVGKNSNDDNLGAYQFIADSQVAATGSLRMGIFSAGTYVEIIRVTNNQRIGMSVTVPLAKLDIDQSGAAAAVPVLKLDQADVDEPFTKYVGSAAAATLSRSIVAEADVTTATRQGFVKIEIEDIGNQVTDQDYFVPFYTLA